MIEFCWKLKRNCISASVCRLQHQLVYNKTVYTWVASAPVEINRYNNIRRYLLFTRDIKRNTLLDFDTWNVISRNNDWLYFSLTLLSTPVWWVSRLRCSWPPPPPPTSPPWLVSPPGSPGSLVPSPPAQPSMVSPLLLLSHPTQVSQVIFWRHLP